MIFFLLFAATISAQQCTTTGKTEACCTEVVGSDLCANMTWNPATKAVDIETSWGPLHLLGYTFSKDNTKYCATKGDPTACVQVLNMTVTDEGTCGCVEVELKAGPIDIKESVGCFAFGAIECPGAECSRFTDCYACNAMTNCGFCQVGNMGQGVCMAGTSAGPGSMEACGAKWIGHKNACLKK